MPLNPDRRSLLCGLLGLWGAALAGAPASSQALVFSDVSVDVRPLLAKGGGAYAEYLRDALTVETRRIFADRIGGRGPRLVVVITGATLNSFAGLGGSRRGGSGGGGVFENDYLEGEALVVGSRGEVLARYPQLSALPASSGGAYYDPLSERRRTVALAQHYAWWLRRTVPST